ncbi:hypothetical protein [Nocardia sp. BMG51109]|uniref:hypothetical protein n=1 Tax=Nocardia sp. BMG51109 TaxID=1056816 RepID=UPI000466B34A|nr:hypothetical protein [Nocardia sp. BMG51109]
MTGKAVGLLCLPLVDDEDTARAELELLAKKHGLDLVQTVGAFPRTDHWLYILFERIRHYDADAVVMIADHTNGLGSAIADHADLITPDAVTPRTGSRWWM